MLTTMTNIEAWKYHKSQTYFGIHCMNKDTGEIHMDICVHTLPEALARFAIINKSSDFTYWVGPSKESGKTSAYICY
jgi:hypothetical protein